MLQNLPNVNFQVRVRDEAVGGDNPYKWVTKNTDDYFKNKKTILFSLPGAFTPTCSTFQLPDFDKLYDDFKKIGIDEIYCISVNDSFVMNEWAKHHKIDKVKVIPDGNGEFTTKMGMLVEKNNLGVGYRSWRYSAYVVNGIVKEMFIEPGINNMSADEDPYEESTPEKILEYVKSL